MRLRSSGSVAGSSDTVRLVSFNGDVDHIELHSFPTRRSSDLRDTGAARNARCRPGGAVPSRARPARAGARSEEHTSELQSRPHLVCRLLLEKKKDRNAGSRAERDDVSQLVTLHADHDPYAHYI